MNIEVRNLELTDYQSLKESMIQSYDNWQTAYWREPQIQNLIEIFPEGQICVIVDGKVAGCALSIIVDYDQFEEKHTYSEITGNYTFSTHDPAGNVLYGIEVFVNPAFRNMRVGRRLYEARKAICENLNLLKIVAGGADPKLS